MKPLQTIALIGYGAMFGAASVLPADAITRLRADQTSCAGIQGTITREGAAVVRYPSARDPSLLLFDRYVAKRSQCRVGEQLDRSLVPASDTASCRVQRCEQIEGTQAEQN